MQQQVEGKVDYDPAQVRAAFGELDGLRRALGRSTFGTVKALLPFSRNDYWEIAELRHRLHRG